MLNTVVMVLVTAFLQWRPEVLVAFFTPEAEAQAVGATFLRIISWTFIAQGVVFTCSGVFQGLGNTIPAMLSSGDSARGVRAARRLARVAARVPPRRGLVALGRDGMDAGASSATCCCASSSSAGSSRGRGPRRRPPVAGAGRELTHGAAQLGVRLRAPLGVLSS